MRCKLCCRFFDALYNSMRKDKQLRAIYLKKFKNDEQSRLAFIVRSRVARDSSISSWIRKELHAMSSEHNSLKSKTHPDASQKTHKRRLRNSTDGSLKRMANPPKVLHNDTRADMNPVATSTQERPHCHLLAIPRCIICPLM